MTSQPRIVFAVTADKSLPLLQGFPAHMVERGWEVHVVSSPGSNLHALGSGGTVHVHSLPMAREPSLLQDLASLVRWLVLLAKLRPTVVSVGTPKAGLLGGVAAWLLRVPFRVYVLRGLRLESAAGAKREFLRRMEQIASRSAHAVIAVSHSLRVRALELGLATPSALKVIGNGSSNGVDVERFNPERIDQDSVSALRVELGLVPGIPVIGFVGRLTIDKGLVSFAQARQLLVDRGVDHQVLLVGGIDDDNADTWVKTLTIAGRPAAVTGHVYDTSPYYRLMDLLCLPSLREGFPNVVLEAAASGVPAVTSDATGAIDSVIDTETGLIARAGDGSDLADRLERLLSLSEAERRVMGVAARERAVREFSHTMMWDTLEAFYRAGLSSAAKESD
jgi:glycosyltransferase involved in cell wall biosynthesis